MFHQVRSRVKDYLGSAISETIVKRRKAAVAQQHAVMMQRKAEVIVNAGQLVPIQYLGSLIDGTPTSV